MTAQLLTLNAGSSSVKFALFDPRRSLQVPSRVGQVDGIGTRQGPPDHARALARVLEQLGGVAVGAVGHRIVHGGTLFAEPRCIDPGVLAGMSSLVPLAPLHQPHNLAGVLAAQAAFPDVPQVACFDTAFHRDTPALNQHFALPRPWFERGVRRYGFHGLSYESIVGQLAAEPQGLRPRTVIAHLGNGASMAAVLDGRAVATTMSFSPLDGLPMGTRCGRIDAAVVLHLMRHEGLSPDEVSRLLHRESGLLGLSGLSSDMRELEASDEPDARLALDYFVEQVLRELAGMAAALRGLDALVFTGGIGENAAGVRARIVQGAAWMGLRLDEQANLHRQTRISRPDSPVEVRVLSTGC
ncbi:MAG: acetate/propionate family kinase, partial [Rhodoferax sp.]|nr:acetate/propionate family kinase [Rhodoferax sp.]